MIASFPIQISVNTIKVFFKVCNERRKEKCVSIFFLLMFFFPPIKKSLQFEAFFFSKFLSILSKKKKLKSECFFFLSSENLEVCVAIYSTVHWSFDNLVFKWNLIFCVRTVGTSVWFFVNKSLPMFLSFFARGARLYA